MAVYQLLTEQNLILWRADRYLGWFVVIDLFSGRSWTLTLDEAIKMLAELAQRKPA